MCTSNSCTSCKNKHQKCEYGDIQNILKKTTVLSDKKVPKINDLIVRIEELLKKFY